MSQTISHQTTQFSDEGLKALVQQTEERLRNTPQLILPLDRTLELLHQLQQFDLGRFLLHNRGLNGYWTAYVFQHAFGKQVAAPLEHWLLTKSLLVQARERFERFKVELGRLVREGAHLASVPSGLMDDLLQLDYRNLRHFQLTGIDVDPESLHLARENARTRGLEAHCHFLRRDAWELGIKAEFDVISSNGLNMYEPNPQRLIELYRNFQAALKEGGHLLISFLTPPPADGSNASAWEGYSITQEDLDIERALFGDVIQVKYRNFSTEDEIRSQLKAAGLTVERVNYNRKGVLPIVIARK